MTDRTKTGLEVLQASFLVGILGNVLLRETPWGLNVLLFVMAFAGGIAMIALRRRTDLVSFQNSALAGAMLFFAAMFAWRDSVELLTADALAIVSLMGVLILSSMNVRATVGGLFHYAVGVVWAGINSSFMAAALLTTDIKWATMPKTRWSKYVVATMRGLLIALPLVLIFGALFVAADAVYQGMVERVFNIPAETVITHLVLTSIFFWLTAGYYRGLLLGIDLTPAVEVSAPARSAEEKTKAETANLSIFDQVRAEEVVNPDALPNNASILDHINTSDPPNAEHGTRTPSSAADTQTSTPDGKATLQWQNFDNSILPQAFTLGAVETSIVLGLINLLFLSFVIVQVPYLFGGMELVQNTPDFKLAEYARRGFGELVAVTALVLPILLLTHWLLRKDSPLNEKLYRVLAGIQIVLLFVIMASAVQRLFLLTGNLGYGLTTVRFYPMVVMIWFAIVFVWFGVTVLRGARQHFAWGALWSALFVLAAVHVVNPDEFIVRTNIALMKQGREFDARYNSAELSNDAVPALIESFDSMSMEDKCWIDYEFKQRRESESFKDLRSFNFSRSKADELLRTFSTEIDTSQCRGKPWL